MRILLALTVVTVALTGCTVAASPDPMLTPTPTASVSINGLTVPEELLGDVEVSPACQDSFRSVQGPVAPAEVEAMFRSVVSACATAAEYVSAHRMFVAETSPGNPYAADHFAALIVACLNSRDLGIESAMCDEAEAEGWLDDLPPGPVQSWSPAPGTD